MLNKHRMDILRNLAANQATKTTTFDDLFQEGLVSVLEEESRVGVVNDGIFIAIARRAMINFKLKMRFPVSVPLGSRYAVHKAARIKEALLEEVEDGTKRRDKQKLDRELSLKEVMEKVHEKTVWEYEEEVVERLLEGLSIREIVDELGDVTFHSVLKTRELVRDVLKKMGF